MTALDLTEPVLDWPFARTDSGQAPSVLSRVRELGMLFAPNHKGMPVRRGVDRNGWLDRQVLISRNIKPSPFIDFLCGGLNYQVEHHHFPAWLSARQLAERPAAG